MTQEALADALYVSRTAVSKWESGRGLPGIDSLKAISKLFSVSIDELLSGEELIEAAETDKALAARNLCAALTGLIDALTLLFLFVPLFGLKEGDAIRSVSLISLTSLAPWLFFSYAAILGVTGAFGIAELFMQSTQNAFWCRWRFRVSIALTVLLTTLFILNQQPYAAFFALSILIFKGFILYKLR